MGLERSDLAVEGAGDVDGHRATGGTEDPDLFELVPRVQAFFEGQLREDGARGAPTHGDVEGGHGDGAVVGMVDEPVGHHKGGIEGDEAMGSVAAELAGEV